MNKIAVLFALALVLAWPATDATAQSAAQAAEMVSSALKLDSSQSTKLNAIMRLQRDQLQQAAKLPMHESRERTREIHANTRAQLNGLLTPEQLARLDALSGAQQANSQTGK